MTIGSILSIVLLFVLLVIALALRDNIAENFGANSEKRGLMDPNLAVFDEMDEDDPVRPSPEFIDRTVDPPPVDDEALAQRTGFTLEQIEGMREIAGGEYSQFCAFDVETEEWSVPVRAIRIDEPTPTLREAREAIAAAPLFADAIVFIVSDALGYEDTNGAVVVVMNADPLEPYRMMPAEDEEGPLTDAAMLEMLEEWHGEAPFEIQWIAPNGFELAFESSDSEIVELIHDAVDIFPNAIDRIGGEEGLENEIRSGGIVQLFWA